MTQRCLAALSLIAALTACAHDASSRAASPSASPAHPTEPPPPAEPAAPAQAERAASPASTAGTGTAGNLRACDLAVYFGSNSAQLDRAARERLDSIATCIRRHEIDHALIEGHTDESPSERRDRDLGLARAQAVAAYLKAKGVPDDMIRVRSKGATAAGSEALWPVARRAAIDLKR